jgi:SAM-dependent methyltransferase
MGQSAAMKFIKIDPPGTLCAHEALRDVLKKTKAHTFVDVGCGAGGISKLLCSMGMVGTGVDFSSAAVDRSYQTLRTEIEVGRYSLIEGEMTSLGGKGLQFDLGVSFMVMEHVADEGRFVRGLCQLVRPDGQVIVGVPGRKDLWCFEDETVGHLRRYDRADLRRVLEASGLYEVEVWSVAVPVANILFRIGEYLVKRSTERMKIGLSQRAQTETSGLQEVPWKTIFPVWVKAVLNRYTLYPLFVLQRLFYRSDLGVILLGFGRVRKSI